MPKFVIYLKIQAGEYEKSSRTLVDAISKEEAEKTALLGECHGSIGSSSEWTEKGIADLNWEFHYSVNSCKEVAEEHVDILCAYFN